MNDNSSASSSDIPGSSQERLVAARYLEALRDKERRLRLVLESAHLGMWEWEVHRNRSQWNAQMYELLGLPSGDGDEPTEVFFRCIHPDDLPAFNRGLEVALKEGSLWRDEFRIIRPSGELRWVAGSGRVHQEPGSASPRMISVNYDITERRRAEAALRESEQRFRASFAHAAIGFALTTADGYYLDANPAFIALTGYTLHELRTIRMAALIHAEDREETQQHIEGLLFGQISNLVIETRYVRKSGASVWVRQSSSLVRNAVGAPQWMITLIEDVNDRKQAEVSLRESRTKLKAALASMTDAVFISDAQGQPVECNDAVATFHRFKTKDEFRQALAEHSDDIEMLWPDGSPVLPGEQPVPRALRGETANAEYVLNRKDTGESWIGSYSFAPIRDKAGDIVGSVVTGRDITEQKRATEAAARSHALAETNGQKDAFIAMLGHELRNPLSALRTAAVLLNRASTEQTRQAAHVQIERQIVHMTRLIDDLLDVARIERGKITLRTTEFDLAQSVRDTMEDHRSLLNESGISFEFRGPPAPLWARGDAARISQIVSNLIVNANKFTDRGGRISVELRQQDAQCAAIVVRDTGIGMDAETLESIFRPFAQADRSMDRSRGGLGLGLSLVKSLAALHGGSVRATSPGLGQGSEFQITLPILIPKPPQQHNDAVAAAAPQARPRRVLVIEDHPSAAQSLKLLLEDCGHAVAVARSGTDGIQQAQVHRPEVVLCDVGLPGMNGYDVARALRSDPNHRATYLIAMTGFAQDQDRQRAQEAGFDIHMSKPVDFDALLQLIERAGSAAVKAGPPQT